MMNLPNTAYPTYRNRALPFTYEGVDYNIDVYAVAGDYYLPERLQAKWRPWLSRRIRLLD